MRYLFLCHFVIDSMCLRKTFQIEFIDGSFLYQHMEFNVVLSKMMPFPQINFERFSSTAALVISRPRWKAVFLKIKRPIRRKFVTMILFYQMRRII